MAGLAAFSATSAGDPLIEDHVETRDGRGHEEVYVVSRGHARFLIDGVSVDGVAGTLVRVDPAARRSAVAAEAGTCVLVVGDEPTFAPGAAEWIERARPWISADPVAAALAAAPEAVESLRADPDLARFAELSSRSRPATGRERERTGAPSSAGSAVL